MDQFIRELPKIELHAHLNGSLSNRNLIELNNLKYGRTTFDKEFYELISTKLSDCFKLFKYAHELTSSKSGLHLATVNVIKDFFVDNVIYLELRTTPRNTDELTKEQYLRTVLEGISDCQKTHPKIMVKLIPSIDRSQGIESAEENLELILRLKAENPEVIRGIDFSGDPSKGNFSQFKHIFEKARNAGLKLAFHCAEIKNDFEVQEMLEFGMDRLGHGTYIDESNPILWNILLKKKIPIECCITSNIKCGTVSSFEDHHFKKLFKLKYPIAICTDDFGIFDTTLSEEMKICAETFDIGEEDLLKLTRNSIRISFASDKDKKYLLNRIDFWNQATE